MVRYLTHKCNLQKSAAEKVAKKYNRLYPGRFDKENGSGIAPHTLN